MGLVRLAEGRGPSTEHAVKFLSDAEGIKEVTDRQLAYAAVLAFGVEENPRSATVPTEQVPQPVFTTHGSKDLVKILNNLAKFWGRPGAEALEAADGMAWSVLCLFDGCNVAFPGFLLLRDDGRVINRNIMLHELYAEVNRQVVDGKEDD